MHLWWTYKQHRGEETQAIYTTSKDPWHTETSSDHRSVEALVPKAMKNENEAR